MAQSLVVDPDLLMVISWQDEPSESKITEKTINKSSAVLSTLERMNSGKKLTVLASVGAADDRWAFATTQVDNLEGVCWATSNGILVCDISGGSSSSRALELRGQSQGGELVPESGD